MTEKNLVFTEKKESFLTIEPKKTSKESIFLIIAIFGFILLFISWYQIESLLWNRIRYSTGSGWVSVAPIYQNVPLADMRYMITSYLVMYLFGILCNIVIIAFLLKVLMIDHIWNENVKKLTIILSISSGLTSITGFWLFNSIWVMEGIKLVTDTGQPGYDWVRIDLGDLSQFIFIIGIIISIIFFILTVITIIYLVSNREKKEKKPGMKQGAEDIIKNILLNIPFYIVLIIYLIFTLLPVYLTLKISISTFSGVFNSEVIEPIKAFIINYSSVIFTVSENETQFGSAFLRSIFIGIGTGSIGLLFSVTAAYSLARFKYRGNKFFTFLIISTQMFPGLILLIPQYLIWSTLGLLEENVVIIGVLLASSTGAIAYCTWMMKGYFETIPIDIEEAAIMDGAGKVGTFVKIALPLVKSGMVAVLLFTLITSWQDFVLARTFIQVETKQTLPLLFYNFQDMTRSDAPVYFDLVAPYSIIVALPIVIFFMLLQKTLAVGAVAGGIK